MYFKGTLLITDPCYLKHKMEKEFDDILEDSILDIKYLRDSTLYGDWGCTTFRCSKKDPKEALKEASVYMAFNNKIGEFCADSGEFCVVCLEDIEELNPNIKDFIIKFPRCVTVIPNWDGEVDYFENEDTGSYSIIGTHKYSYYNFFTIQTSL